MQPEAPAATPDPANPRLILYVGRGCHLCSAALAALERVARRQPFTLEVREIEQRPEWEAAYRLEIPLLFIEELKAFKYRIDEAELLRRLRRRARATARATAEPPR
jgi:hypothetical protein